MALITSGEPILAKPAQRISALDLARVFAMLMMIQGHAVDALVLPDRIDLTMFPWNIWEFLRGLTAPVFLMVSGAVHVFANKRPENGIIPVPKLLKRVRTALALIAIGYLLVFPAEKIYDLFFIEHEYWIAFFQVNILHIFGISLLFATFLFWKTRSDRTLMIAALSVGIGITLLTPAIHLINWFNFLPEGIAAYLSMEHGSIFTIFPFSAFLFFGIALGVFIKGLEPEKRISVMIRYGLPAGLLLVLLGNGLSYVFGSLFHHNYVDAAKADPGIVIFRMGMVLVWIAATSIIFMKTKGLENVYKMFGKRALLIYVVHLFVIFGTPVFPGFATFWFKSLSLGNVIVVTILIELITLTFTYFVEFTLRKYPQAEYFWRYSVTAYLIYMLFI